MRLGSGDQTRDRIIGSASQLFTQRGPKATSVQDIVDHAGLTKGAFYHHFDSKNKVIAEVDRLRGSQRQNGRPSPIDETPRTDGDTTRQRILDAALELFAQRGFTATSVQDIVERAGLTKGAFYHHFDSKQAVLLEIYSILPNAYIQNARAIADSDLTARAALVKIIEAVSGIVADYRPLTTVWVGELRMMRDETVLDPARLTEMDALSAESIEIVVEILRRGVETGEFHPVDDEHAVAFAILSLPVFVYSWLDVERPVTKQGMTKVFSDLLLRGLDKAPPRRPSTAGRRRSVDI